MPTNTTWSHSRRLHWNRFSVFFVSVEYSGASACRIPSIYLAPKPIDLDSIDLMFNAGPVSVLYMPSITTICFFRVLYQWSPLSAKPYNGWISFNNWFEIKPNSAGGLMFTAHFDYSALCRYARVTSFENIWWEKIVAIHTKIVMDFYCMVTKSCTKDVFISSRYPSTTKRAFQTSFFVTSFFITSSKQPPWILAFFGTSSSFATFSTQR